MVWTVSKTWAVGETVTASMLNTYVRDNLDYLFNGRGVYKFHKDLSGDGQDILADTLTSVTFEKHSVDSDTVPAAMHSTTSNNERITLFVPGFWLILARCTIQPGAISGDNMRKAHVDLSDDGGSNWTNRGAFDLNELRPPPGTGREATLVGSGFIKSDGARMIRMRAHQTNGETLTISKEDYETGFDIAFFRDA